MDKETFEQKLQLYKEKAREQLERNNRDKQSHKGGSSNSKIKSEVNIDTKQEMPHLMGEITSDKKEALNIETANIQSTDFLAQIEKNIQRNKATTIYQKRPDKKYLKAQIELQNNIIEPAYKLIKSLTPENTMQEKQEIIISKPNVETIDINKEKPITTQSETTSQINGMKRSQTCETINTAQMSIPQPDNIPLKETKTVATTNIAIEKPEPSLKKAPTKKELDIEYCKEIESNPMAIYDIITEERIVFWKDKMKSSFSITFTDDSTILNVSKNHEHQKVIQNDCNRTRVREAVLLPNFREYIELFLTYYCKKENIAYKQGLNEIAAPMLLLQYRLNISFSEIYSLIKAFVNKFLTNYYRNQNLVALKSSLCLLTILLKYHEPSVFNILEYALMTPEVYATSWILTTFSSKCRLDVVYHLWDFLITHDDNLMMHFIIVSFFHHNKDKLNTSDVSFIPAVVCSICIDTVEDLKQILKTALTLRETTPYSFRILATNLELFKFDHPQLQQAFDVYRPDTITAMPFFPSEIFFNTYRGSVNCPDDRCFVMKILALEAQNRTNRLEIGEIQAAEFNENINHVCEHCDLSINKKIIYILLDLRILDYGSKSEAADNTGFLPNMIMVPQEELTMETFTEMMAERFTNDKGLYHFVFLTSKTDYFTDFETNFYSENITEEERKRMKFGYQTKIEKELNKNVTNSMTKKEKLKLKEYDNLKKLLVSFLKADYPYISYAYGGFHAIHDKSFKYDISILDHDQKCLLCTEARKSKKPTVMKELVKYYQRHKASSTAMISSQANELAVKPLEPLFLFQINDIIAANLSLLLQAKEFFFNECNITHIANSVEEVFLSSLLTINNFEIQIYILHGAALNNSSLVFREKIMITAIKGYEFDKKKRKCDILLEDDQGYEIIFSLDDEAKNFLRLVKDGLAKKKK